MTDEQNNSAEKRPHSFGDIPIPPKDDSILKKTTRRKTKPTRPAPLRPDITTTPASNRPGTAKKRTFPFLTLLCIPVAFFALYLAAALYLVPILIKGPLATQLGQRLNRSISAGNVSFSPFSFRLHLKNFTIGPDPSRKDDPVLCRAAVLDGHVLPTSLLRGKVVLEDVHIEQLVANLVRYRDGRYNIFSAWPAGDSGKAMNYSNPLPKWLLIQGLQLADGTIIFHDLPVDRQHRIGQIQVSLPAAGSEKTDGEPMLSAMVNSSPILIRGQRHTTADGRTETKVSLQLKALNPQQYLAYFPGATSSLTVTNGSTDAELYITFQDINQPGSSLAVTGKATLSDLVLQDKNKTFQLKVSTAQIVLRARPLRRLYTIEEFVIDTPQVTLTNNQPSSLMNIHSRLASSLKQAGFGLEIDRLQVNNGSMENNDRKGYHDLHILLTEFRNQAAVESSSTSSKLAHLTVTANNGDATIAFQGEVNSSLTPTGKISLQNMDTALLQPYLPTADTLFSKGKIELAGTLLTKQDRGDLPVWEITDSSLQIHNFSLTQKDSLMIGGQKLSGRECRVQINNHRVFCRRLSLDNAHFAGKAAAFLLGNRLESIDDGRPFSFNNLAITNSTALVPLSQTVNDGKEPQIKLSDLSLDLTGMDQAQQDADNLSIQAAVGKQGKVKLSGHMQRNGQGVVQLSATDIDITPLTPLFSSWLTLPVHQGSLQLKGRLKLPDNQFIGSFQLNDFTAEKKGGPAVRWQHASGTGVTARLTPFSAAIREFSLQQPAIRLSPGNQPLPSGFLEFFRKENNSPVLPPLKIERCTISNGSLQRKPVSPTDQHLTEFSQVEATLTPLQPATQSSFNLSGRMDAADFSITGRTGINTSDNYELEVNRFPLTPFTPLFSQSLGIDVQNGVADWLFSTSSLDSDWIRMSGLVPTPGSDLSMTLALLTDEKGSFSLPVPPESAGDPTRLLKQVVIGQLRQLRLQAVISSRLVLDKFLPELNLPGNVEFLPAETVPDFMEGLEDYATLLQLRPHLGLIIRGNYDETTDRQYLLQVLQEAEDAQRELENLRREQLRTKLLVAEQQQLASLTKQGLPADKEKLHQIEQQPDLQPLARETVQLPVNTLQDLAQQRAEVIRSYLTDQLRIPADKIEIQESIPDGTKTDLILQPLW